MGRNGKTQIFYADWVSPLSLTYFLLNYAQLYPIQRLTVRVMATLTAPTTLIVSSKKSLLCQTCPSQKKDLLTALGAIDPSDSRLITFDLNNTEPRLSPLVTFQVPITINNIIIN